MVGPVAISSRLARVDCWPHSLDQQLGQLYELMQAIHKKGQESSDGED